MWEEEREERSGGHRWWNEDVKEAILRKKDAHKEMCKSGTEANKARYKNMKVVAKAMKEATEQELRELSEHPNKVFKLVNSMKKDGKDVEGGRCMRVCDDRLSFSEKDRGKVWKEHMERIMNEENEWDQNVEADLVEGPVERVSREEVVKAIREMYMCFVDLQKAFDRVPRKVLEWAVRKRGIPAVMVRTVMSLYEGGKTRVRVGLELSEEMEVKDGVHQGSVLLPLVLRSWLTLPRV